MAARDMALFLPSGVLGRSAEDTWLYADVPYRVVNGRFRISFIPYPSYVLGTNTILSVGTDGSHDTGISFYDAGGGQIDLVAFGVIVEDIEFAELQEVTLTLDAIEGTIEIEGLASGDGTHTGTPWFGVFNASNNMRIGGTLGVTGETAYGWVSLPYAIVPDPEAPEGGQLDWSEDDGHNTGWLGWF